MDHALDGEAASAAYARFPRRLMAMLVDGAVLASTFIVLAMVASAAESQLFVQTSLALLVLSALLYDPVLVSTTGGTLGHHWLNLKVVADESGGRLPFGRAVARGLLKGILGIVSFVFMAVTRRRQALHDLASHSTVQIKDRSRAQIHHYAGERIEEEPAGVSRVRRLMVVFAHIAAAFIVMSILSAFLVSENCLMGDACTSGDELISMVLGFGWMGASAWFLAQGWRGRLFGARPRPN